MVLKKHIITLSGNQDCLSHTPAANVLRDKRQLLTGPVHSLDQSPSQGSFLCHLSHLL